MNTPDTDWEKLIKLNRTCGCTLGWCKECIKWKGVIEMEKADWLRSEIEKLESDESYHYWRECHKCGHAGNYYLHCLHDMVQSACVKCGEILPSIYQECDCEFVTTESEKTSIIARYKEELLELEKGV